MVKRILAILLLLILVFSGACSNQTQDNADIEQEVCEQTLDISKMYLALRYQSDYILVNAEEYSDYDLWYEELSELINAWGDLEEDAANLNEEANRLTKEKSTVNIGLVAQAYDSYEVSAIVDSVPFGKKIKTLANHLGVDAQTAQLILNQAQAEVSREAYGEEGDVFEECENKAVRLKNACKVAGFVGGVVLTGGASAVVAGGALAKTAVVIAGADLALEITDDEAKIALGDKNKVSEFVGTVRTVTEPAAAILTIANLPQNVTKAADKLGMAIFTSDQLRSVVQDGKIIGISLEPQEKGQLKTEVAALSEEELPIWREDNNALPSGETIAEALNLESKDHTEATDHSQQPEETNPSDQEDGALTGEQQMDPVEQV